MKSRNSSEAKIFKCIRVAKRSPSYELPLLRAIVRVASVPCEKTFPWKRRANFVRIINYREVTGRDGGVSAHQESRSCGVNALGKLRLERQREREHAGHL